MQIAAIRTHLVRDLRTMLIVEVETDCGLTGLGEAGLTSRERAVAGMIEDLSDLLIGQDATRIEHHWQRLWRSGFHPSGQVLSAAIAAIDIALWDIRGKALGVPVHDLLGGRCRDRVMTYCHLRESGPEALLAEARARVAEGWKALRWEPRYEADSVLRPAAALDQAVAEFRLLRAELGPGIELLYDVHTRLTPPEAAWLCNAVADCRPAFIEDPLRAELPAAYATLRGLTPVPLAAGEQFGPLWQWTDLLQNRLIDFARIDLCIAGGLSQGRKIAAMAEANMIDVVVHNPIGPVSTAACLHLNMAIPNVGLHELPRRPGEMLAGLIETDARWEDGYLIPGGGPGLGLTFHPERLGDYPFTPEHLPMLTRPDGSATNW